jgi:molybdopterin molybdotransferase
MHTYEKILRIIERINPDFQVEHVPVHSAVDRILQQDVVADMNMPPFTKSSMDGYACKRSDLSNELQILETIPAGKVPEKEITSNTCSKIMTGAELPKGADCVFKIEDSTTLANGKVICLNQNTADNIIPDGLDYLKGDVLIRKGEIISPAHVAVIAGAGISEVAVTKKISLGLIVSGSELVSPEDQPQGGKIRNTNADTIISLIKRMNLEVAYYGIVPDQYDTIKNAINESMQKNDVTIITGGASVGQYDLIPKILEKEKFHTFWNRTGIKPGNPMSFSIKEKKYCVGLSGNPVSSLVQFEMVLKPILYKLMGAKYQPKRFLVPIKEKFERKDAARLGLIPVNVEEGVVKQIKFNGSAHIHALTFANAFMEIPIGVNEVEPGALVNVRPL